MHKVNSTEELKEAIRLLEIKQEKEATLLKEQFRITYDSLRPINLLKDTIKGITTFPELKGNILDTVMSLAAGFLSKKIVVGKTYNPLKQVLGTFLQMGVTNIVSKNSDGIRSKAAHFIHNYLSKRDRSS